MIRDLYAHMPTPNYVKHLSPTVDAIEKYAISIMYQVPSDLTILAQHLKNIPTTNYKKMHSLTPLMLIKLPVHENRSQLSTLPSHPMPYTQVNQPSPVFLSSHLFPLIKHSHIMHSLPHKNPIFTLQPYNNLPACHTKFSH